MSTQESVTEKRTCPKCHSPRVWKAGLTATVKAGKRQRYVCGDCGISWY